MKNNFFLSLTVLCLLAGCSGNKQTAPEVVDQNQTSASDSTARVIDGSTAEIALDYQGTYVGALPGASGTINTTIILADSTYTKTMLYVNQKQETTNTGKYTWGADGNTITLVDGDKPNQYIVGENTLTQLDVEGKKITGNMADLYILKKENIQN